jgi:hypothetical protein
LNITSSELIRTVLFFKSDENLSEKEKQAMQEVLKENNGYTKSISFLEGHFKNMTTFLRAPGVKRNCDADFLALRP